MTGGSSLVLTLHRADLVAGRACARSLATFDAVCALRGEARAPLVRGRDGVTRRDPARLRIVLTPLAQLWLARDARDAVVWLRSRGLLPPVSMPYGVDLQGANLQGAYLRGAYLRGAYLQGAYLQGADLQGADLQGAARGGFDAPVDGWTLRDGTLTRSGVA